MPARPYTRTRTDIVEALVREVGLSHAESAGMLESVLEKMAVALEEEGVVKISSFGSFQVHGKRERPGRNPRTGDPAVVSARNVLVYKPSISVRKTVDEMNASGAESQ